MFGCPSVWLDVIELVGSSRPRLGFTSLVDIDSELDVVLIVAGAFGIRDEVIPIV
jgi:hypothetical protein